MSLFLHRYREMSRRSTTAFWSVKVSAGVGLTLTAAGLVGGHRSAALDAVHGLCTFVMFVSLGVLGIGLMLESHQRTR